MLTTAGEKYHFAGICTFLARMVCMDSAVVNPGPGEIRGRRARGWAGTCNNPTEEDYASLDAISEDSVTFLGYQTERGAEGTEHIQWYIRWKNPCTMAQAKGRLTPRFHLEPARNHEACKKYCLKEESRIIGPSKAINNETCGPGQGTRTDILNLVDAARQKRSFNELVDEFPVPMAKYYKFVEAVRSHIPAEGEFNRKVIFQWGPTGTGKSWATWQSPYRESRWQMAPPGGSNAVTWCDGYDGQDTAVFEEYTHPYLRTFLLLQLTDKYPFNVNVRGGTRLWKPTTIFINSNLSFEDTFKDVPYQQQDALRRRMEIRPMLEHYVERQPETINID